MCFTGVCLGMQLAVCEFARNVLGWKGKLTQKALLIFKPIFFYTLSDFICVLCPYTGANSTEFDPDTKYPVVSNLFNTYFIIYFKVKFLT